MRRRIFLLLLLSLLILQVPASAAKKYNGYQSVYVTATGDCYHRRGCSYAKSGEEMALRDAVDAGYQRCSRCNPPKLRGNPYSETPPASYTERKEAEAKAAAGASLSDDAIDTIVLLVVFSPYIFWGIVFGTTSLKERIAKRYLASDAGKPLREKYFRQGYLARKMEEDQK